ncbi:MAG: ketoacyl-ACP synthase III [Methylotenera sp.]|nr:ketoacyl-ACP synthase III [Oligoflexia bacterium]
MTGNIGSSSSPSESPYRSPFGSTITGTGSAFPKNSVSNEALCERLGKLGLEELPGFGPQWIEERTGIRSRGLSTPGDEADFNSSLGWQASLRALEMAGKTALDIDAIFYATCTPDTIIPSTACWLQKKLGAKNAFAFDLNAACSGFVFALSTADQFIKSGQVKTALVVGADVLSAFTNWEDRKSCIVFADGAGAAIVERTPANARNRILASHLKSDGEAWDLFQIRAGGSNQEVTEEMHSARLDKMQMKGTEIFKAAVKTMATFAAQTLESHGLAESDIDWIVPHQANLRLMEAVARRLGASSEKFLVNIDRVGNTSAATVPTVLDEAVRSGKIKPGQLLLMDVFGAGLTYGTLLLRWGPATTELTGESRT